MWSVLRRYQGVEYDGPAAAPQATGSAVTKGTQQQHSTARDGAATTSSSSGTLVANQRAIRRHQCQPFIQPVEASSRLMIPYGDLVYGQLLRYLSTHESASIRIEALDALLDLYSQKTEHVVKSIAEDAVRLLTTAVIGDSDEEVRSRACVALQHIVRHPLGQQQVLAEKALPKFLDAVDDTSLVVVAEALRLCCACHAMHHDYLLTKELIRFGAIPKYRDRGASPSDDVCASAFAALAKVFDVKEAFIQVIDHGCLAPLTSAVATREDPGVLVEAAECIGKLAFYASGKRAAVQHSTLAPVLQLVTHADPVVRTGATGALVALTVSEQGKVQAIQHDAVSVLVSAIETEDERDILMNDVKTICNLSEHPVARLKLQAALPRLEAIREMASVDHPSLAENVRRCVSMIKWTPGDPPA